MRVMSEVEQNTRERVSKLYTLIAELFFEGKEINDPELFYGISQALKIVIDCAMSAYMTGNIQEFVLEVEEDAEMLRTGIERGVSSEQVYNS